MVGDQDALGAKLHAALGVLWAADTLEDDRKRRGITQPLEVLPREARIDGPRERLLDAAAGVAGGPARALQVDDAQALRHAEVVADVALADAPDGGIHGEHQRIAARGLRALREGAHHAAVAADVHLHPGARGRVHGGSGGADVLDGGGREARDDHRHAGARTGTGRGQLAVRVRHLLERGGRHAERHGGGAAEDGGGGGARGDVAHHAVPDPQAFPGGAVLAQGGLCPRAAAVVVAGHRREHFQRVALEIVEVEERGEVGGHGEGNARAAERRPREGALDPTLCTCGSSRHARRWY